MAAQENPLLARFNAMGGFNQQIGIEVESVAPGSARVRVPFSERVTGGVANSIHGGVLSSLADVAALVAMLSPLDDDDRRLPNGTVELSISFVRPATGAYVVAAARVLKKGASLAVVDVDITDPDARLVAKARVTYAVRTVESQ